MLLTHFMFYHIMVYPQSHNDEQEQNLTVALFPYVIINDYV